MLRFRFKNVEVNVKQFKKVITKAVIVPEVNMEVNIEQMITEDDELIVPMSIEYREDITADDFRELCRLCGNCSHQLMPIFAGDGLEHDLSGKIREYLPITVSFDDDLPSKICYQCASTLISWHELYYACKEADQRLKELSSRLCKVEKTAESFGDVFEEKYDYGEDVTDSIFVSNEIKSDDVDNATEGQFMKIVEPPQSTDSNDRFHSMSSSLEVVKKAPPTDEEDPIKSDPVVDKCAFCNVDVENGISYDGSLLCLNCSEEYQYENGKEGESSPTISKHELELFEGTTYFRDTRLEKRIVEKEDVVDTYLNNPVKIERVDHVTLSGNKGSESELRCASCLKTFQRRGSLIAHLRKHDKLTCKICNSVFKSAAHLKTHKKRHVRKLINNTLLYCENCKKYFKTRKGLEYHQRNICIQHKCFLCDETFPTAAVMQEHVKLKHDVQKKPFEGDISTWKDDNETVMSACPVCSKIVTKARMARHMLLHVEDKPYICDLCGKRFKRKHSLQDHIMIEMGMKNYVCDVCGMKFLKQGYLNKHQRYHKLNNGEFQGFRCEVCGKRFPEKWRLGVHQRAVHKGGKFATCKCDVCDQQFAERWMVRKHKHLEHNGEEFHEYVCDMCGKKFLEKWMMRSHQRATHRSFGKKQYCDHCGRGDHVSTECAHRHVLQEVNCQLCDDQFTSNYLLKEHVNAVHTFYGLNDLGLADIVDVELLNDPLVEEKSSVLYTCPGCGDQFLSKQALKEHEMRTQCCADTKYECIDCEKVFTSKFSLSNHLMSHKKALTPLNYKCELCDKDFFTSEALENHQSLEKVCLLCDKVYPCNDHLKNHVFSEHNNDEDFASTSNNVDSSVGDPEDKPFECKLCGKKFHRKQAMKNHLYAEMNLRRYVCEFCDKSYNYYSHLKEHLISCHADKEYTCGYCGKEFPSRKRFRDHVTLHSEDKPFQCVCGLSFKLNRYLSKHKKHCKLSKDSLF